MQGYKDCLNDIELMYHILRNGLRIAGLPQQYSRVFSRTVIHIGHTSKAPSCRVWWSQNWHHTHNPLNGQFSQVASHYLHMIPLQSMPLNNSFCSIPSIYFLPFCMVWICASQHTKSFIFQKHSFWVQPRLIPLGIKQYLNQCLIGMWCYH